MYIYNMYIYIYSIIHINISSDSDSGILYFCIFAAGHSCNILQSIQLDS